MKRTKPVRSARRKGRWKVLIVDDHPIFRQGLVQLIKQVPELAVCGEAESAAEAIEAVDRWKPDMAIVDVSLKDSDGIDLVQMLKGRFPDLPVLVLSLHEESLYAEAALRAGALGYVMKHEPIEKVTNAIRRVLAGEVYLSERMSARILRCAVGHEATSLRSPVERLSTREMQVFRLLGEGKGTNEIARDLNLCVSTVETHRTNIKRKLHWVTNAELVKQAIQWCRLDAAFVAHQ